MTVQVVRDPEGDTMPRTKPKPSPSGSSAHLPAGTADVLTLAEAAAYLRTSPEEVLRLVRDQGLPGRKVGDDCRFLIEAIRDWLRAAPSGSSKQGFWQSHFGALANDPYLEELLGEIYRRRGRPEVQE
jgi:excisionase family DNA binding protein